MLRLRAWRGTIRWQIVTCVTPRLSGALLPRVERLASGATAGQGAGPAIVTDRISTAQVFQARAACALVSCMDAAMSVVARRSTSGSSRHGVNPRRIQNAAASPPRRPIPHRNICRRQAHRDRIFPAFNGRAIVALLLTEGGHLQCKICHVSTVRCLHLRCAHPDAGEAQPRPPCRAIMGLERCRCRDPQDATDPIVHVAVMVRQVRCEIE